MAGLPKLKPKTTSKRQVDSLSLKSCPEFSTMARTRHYTFSEGTSSSKEDDNTEGLYSFKTLEDHIQGCVSRFIESSRKSGALSPCKKVGNYYVGRQLGEGTFGKVKLGIHMLAGVKVAVKMYSKKQAVDSYVLQNVYREVKLMQRVQHHNIVQLFDFIETDNNYYLVTELCSNGSLLDLVVMRGSIEEGETREYLRQIVSAVDCLHCNNIVHRDIKLENLLLTSSMTVKLIDFGLSNTEGSQTQCGSPLYAAPEMLGAKSYGKEVDIWSIGVCLYMMLMGTPPYQPEATAGIAGLTLLHAKMMDGRMNRISDNISTSCQNLILKMLCYDPKKRLSIEESQKHPWITMKGFYPLPPAPVCRAVTYDDVNQFVLSYMSELETMKGQNTDVLVQNILDRKMTTATSTYHLLVKAFEQCQARHKKAPTSGITCKRSSSDNSLAKKAGGSKTAHTSEFNRRISESQLPPLPMSEGLSSARKMSTKTRYSPTSTTIPHPPNVRCTPPKGQRPNTRQTTSTGKRQVKTRHLSREMEVPPTDFPKLPKEHLVKEADLQTDRFGVLETINESSTQRHYKLVEQDHFAKQQDYLLFPLPEDSAGRYPNGVNHRRPQTHEKSNRWLWKRAADKHDVPDALPDIDKDSLKSAKNSLEPLPFEEWIESSNGDFSDLRDN